MQGQSAGSLALPTAAQPATGPVRTATTVLRPLGDGRTATSMLAQRRRSRVLESTRSTAGAAGIGELSTACPWGWWTGSVRARKAEGPTADTSKAASSEVVGMQGHDLQEVTVNAV